MKTAKTYWWKDRPNFGDRLSPLILQHFAGIDPIHAQPAECTVAGIGSVIDELPPEWGGLIAGAGKRIGKAQNLANAHILGVRGPLTAQLLGIDEKYVVSDPALLVSEFVQVDRGVNDLGVMPHWTDTTLLSRFAYLKPIYIDPAKDPIEIIKDIGSCRKIVSSSLHGIIVADAFGIPRRAERFPVMNNKYEGGDFKWQDYGLSIDQPVEFETLQWAKPRTIQRMQTKLFKMLKSLGRIINAS